MNDTIKNENHISYKDMNCQVINLWIWICLNQNSTNLTTKWFNSYITIAKFILEVRNTINTSWCQMNDFWICFEYSVVFIMLQCFMLYPLFYASSYSVLCSTICLRSTILIWPVTWLTYGGNPTDDWRPSLLFTGRAQTIFYISVNVSVFISIIPRNLLKMIKFSLQLLVMFASWMVVRTRM